MCATGDGSYRLDLYFVAIEAAMRHPLGATKTGWEDRTCYNNTPHSDIFYLLGVFGFLPTGLYLIMVLIIIGVIKRVPIGFKKLYVRSTFIFMMIMRLDVAQVLQKYTWVFLMLILASERAGRLFAKQSDDQRTCPTNRTNTHIMRRSLP